MTITAEPVNDPPTANDDAFFVQRNSGPHNLNVLANDTIAPDIDETLSIVSAGPGSADCGNSRAADRRSRDTSFSAVLLKQTE